MDISGNELKAWILQLMETEGRDFARRGQVAPEETYRHIGRQEGYEQILREVWNMEDKLDKAIDQDYRDGKFN